MPPESANLEFVLSTEYYFGYSLLLSVGALLCDVVTPVQERATVFQSVRRFVFSGDLVFSISFAGVSARVLVISLVLECVSRESGSVAAAWRRK